LFFPFKNYPTLPWMKIFFFLFFLPNLRFLENQLRAVSGNPFIERRLLFLAADL